MENKIAAKHYDCVIVGAGPAGCSAAFFITQLGFEVLLIDKAKFPREKICGDGITSLAVTILDRMGVLGKIEAIKPWKIYSASISSPNHAILKGSSPIVEGLPDHGFCIPRMKFDNIIFNHIKSVPGVSVIENFTVKDLYYEGSRICGVTGDLKNKSVNLTADYIIGADGANSVIAKRLNLYNNNPDHRAMGLRAYFENVEGLDNSFELHYDELIMPGYGWIFPTAKDKANVGVGIFNRFDSGKGTKELFEKYITGNIYAKEKLKNARMVKGSLKGFPLVIGSYPKPRYKDNVILLGDAGSLIDPISGDGIYYALRSGEYAARAMEIALIEKKKKGGVGKQYNTLLKKSFKWKVYIPRYIILGLMNNKFILNLLVNFASKKQSRADKAAELISHSKNKIFRESMLVTVEPKPRD